MNEVIGLDLERPKTRGSDLHTADLLSWGRVARRSDSRAHIESIGRTHAEKQE
jgi:hypothetical protein